MRYLYNDDLTDTEIAISDTIKNNIDLVLTKNIVELAEFCNVSPSKITKYAKRLGFNGYKEFIYQLKRDKNNNSEISSAFDYQKEKIEHFFEAFDAAKLEQLKEYINNSEKVYFFGRGPSLKVSEYFVPRLRVATSKNIIANYDEYLFDLDVAEDENRKLMIILTVSGKSEKVHEVANLCKSRGIKSVVISAYSNEKLKANCDLFINLMGRKEVFDKSLIRGRTLFYIYLEILTQDFMEFDK